jgi:hypothetical protein
VALSGTDADLAAVIRGVPANTDPQCKDRYQVRVYDGSSANPPTGSAPNYWETDIKVVTAADGTKSWAVLCPLVQLSTTTLQVTPMAPPYAGYQVTLQATVTPVFAGTLQFFGGGQSLGGPQSVPADTGSVS